MVRDPIKRILSHWVHATGAGYETREMVPTLSDPDTQYVNRSKYWMQLQPYLELFDREQIEIITQEELQTEREETMRKAFAFAGVDENFTSEQFDREWEKSSAKEGDKYQFMEKLIKLPGFRSFDRNFDRLPESMRWMVEKVVHDPEKPPAPKPKLPDDLLRDASAAASARTSPGCRSSPAASSPAGTTTAEPAPVAARDASLGSGRCGASSPIPARPRSSEQLDAYRPWEEPRRGSPLRRDQLRHHGRRPGDDRRRLRADRLRRRHGDAGRPARPASTR